MSKQDGDASALEHIPDVDGVIVVSSKQQATCKREDVTVIKPVPSFLFFFS